MTMMHGVNILAQPSLYVALMSNFRRVKCDWRDWCKPIDAYENRKVKAELLTENSLVQLWKLLPLTLNIETKEKYVKGYFHLSFWSLS